MFRTLARGWLWLGSTWKARGLLDGAHVVSRASEAALFLAHQAHAPWSPPEPPVPWSCGGHEGVEASRAAVGAPLHLEPRELQMFAGVLATLLHFLFLQLLH